MITLAATPIGNPLDASARLLQLLQEADVVAAEDTRRVRDLANRLGVRISGTVLAYHEHNEASRTEELLDHARGGRHVVVVSDAGMPGISDPGYRLVTAAAAAGVRVTAAPGPSAVVTALALSGLPSDRFTFEGFLPRRAGQRAALLADVADEKRTMVFYEAPHRIVRTLEAMAGTFGADRPAAMCRELTKTYEEVTRGTLADLLARAEEGVRGEIVIVVGGARAEMSVDELLGVALERIAGGVRMKEAVADLAEEHGVSRRELYEAVLAAGG